MDTDARRRICRLIAGLVGVDNELDDTESAFVDNMLVKFGLSPDERESLFPIIDGDEAAKELADLPAAMREQAFALLVDAAAADKRFVDEERDYLHKVGAVLGLSHDEVDRRVSTAIG